MKSSILHITSVITLALFLFISLATGEETSSTSKTPGEDEYKCGKCFAIKKKSKGCYTKLANQCSYVSHTDKAFGGNYFYCSRSCCEK